MGALLGLESSFIITATPSDEKRATNDEKEEEEEEGRDGEALHGLIS